MAARMETDSAYHGRRKRNAPHGIAIIYDVTHRPSMRQKCWFLEPIHKSRSYAFLSYVICDISRSIFSPVNAQLSFFFLSLLSFFFFLFFVLFFCFSIRADGFKGHCSLADRLNIPTPLPHTRPIPPSGAADIAPQGETSRLLVAIGHHPKTPHWCSGGLRTQKLRSHSVENQNSKVLPLKPGVGKYIAMHATTTASSTLPVHSPAFFQTSPDVLLCFL